MTPSWWGTFGALHLQMRKLADRPSIVVLFRHHLYLDSYYTSLELLNDLWDRDVYAVGTVKAQMSAGLPPVLTDKNSAFSKSMTRGDCHQVHTCKY